MSASAAPAGYALPDDGLVGRGPWNPGIESTLPRRFLPLTTLYRPENVATPLAEAMELSAFSGLPMPEIVAFRPDRLVVHELLIRVMADLSVPVGETYGDLGVNFRAIVAHILATAIAPHADRIAETLRAVADEARARIAVELDAAFAPPAPPPPPPRTWRHVLGLAAPPAPVADDARSTEERALAHCAAWCVRAAASENALELAASAALHKVASGIVRHRGKLVGDRALLANLATTLVANDEGSRRIGCLIEPWFAEAVAREGYVPVRAQAAPIVMNVKGASASGKSTMRPLQRALARRLGESWSDFAVITPDIWRKFLLDYDSIGDAIGYAGTLTGHEVEIVDRKLDRYMARKAREGRMSHLLIDRFRFDSFNADSRTQDGSQLLTRFGHRVFMLFMITPPDATVERAWIRGRIFGRYKAVDDLLAHNVEAFTGMPELFFTWAAKAGKQVHYEFLDNSVPQGERPRTVAFGENGDLTVLDAGCLIDIARYTKINIDALSPAEVYPDAAALAPERNTGFLRQCARRLRSVRFAEAGSGRVYARFEAGRLACLDRAAFDRACHDPETRAALAAFGAERPEAVPVSDVPPEILSQDRTETLGAWVDPSRMTVPA
ncbi:zeta toxin family protein [Methylobacterium sp. E-016]|uniref:zeta toxin family protein n=1 Tax=Methylobacterium sp. E-016 TaxID=2836556 RepID=UPI001FB8CA26|nr:zeta toxin family protein [Methylobacterium sp. E-016]MCJ2075727.1 zeta toxin family protein [Methylobacterium sp. E-016]